MAYKNPKKKKEWHKINDPIKRITQKQKIYEWNKEWIKKHPETRKKIQKKYYEKNRETEKARTTIWHELNYRKKPNPKIIKKHLKTLIKAERKKYEQHKDNK